MLAPVAVRAGFTHTGTINSSGRKHLSNGYVYTVANDVTIKAGAGLSGIYLDANSTAVLYIPSGVTLKVQGGAGQGTSGAGAGIEVPSSSTPCPCARRRRCRSRTTRNSTFPPRNDGLRAETAPSSPCRLSRRRVRCSSLLDLTGRRQINDAYGIIHTNVNLITYGMVRNR